MRGEGGGPSTPGGKAVVSRNALKHGLTSPAPVIQGLEDPADWQRHLDGMMESLQPDGWHETVLAERIALFLWRSRRAVQFELAQIDAGQSRVEQDLKEHLRATAAGTGRPHREPSEAAVQLVRMMRTLPDDRELATVMRFEAHLHRQYVQCLHELEAMQARRNGERVPLARLDISASPG